ncbi:hypothetical protein D3C76_1713120 [compost metagenome]
MPADILAALLGQLLRVKRSRRIHDNYELVNMLSEYNTLGVSGNRLLQNVLHRKPDQLNLRYRH